MGVVHDLFADNTQKSVVAPPVSPDAGAVDSVYENDAAAQPVTSEDASSGGLANFFKVNAFPLALLAVLLVIVYFHVAVKLVTDWIQIEEDSAGLLIPFFVAYLIWDKRAELSAVPVRRTWTGIWLVVLGLLEFLVGVFGADLFLARTSFLLVAAGIIWTLLGPAMLRKSKFILFICLLGIPLPVLVLSRVTFPLQLLASRVSSTVLPIFQVPVLQEGNVIQLPAMQLEVAEACSGIRSLMSLFTVAVIYGYFLEKSITRRVILALSSIPIAVVANSARIIGTGLCVQYWDPVKAMGFFHEFSGWLIFLVSLACLYLVHTTMRMIGDRKRRTA
jgi:exosortase